MDMKASKSGAGSWTKGDAHCRRPALHNRAHAQDDVERGCAVSYRISDNGENPRMDANQANPSIDFDALIRGFIANPDVRDLQHAIAAQFRRTFGHVPRGQLWQPCEVKGCDEEPVCMNCLRCTARHCKCFTQHSDGRDGTVDGKNKNNKGEMT